MIETLAKRIGDGLGSVYKPLLPDIITAASMAQHKLLGSVKIMWLEDVDLASVPAEYLASLASCVTERVYITNVSNCDIISILDNVKCEWLKIKNQRLSSAETQALVKAMESNVEMVILGSGDGGEVSLDILALTQYSGEGKCWQVSLRDTEDKYREEVRS